MSDAEAITYLLVATVICVSGPLFFCVSVLLTVIYLKYRQRAKESERVLLRHAEESEQALTERITTLEQLVEELKRDALQVSRDEWLKDIRRTSYRNEIEVEVKFIHPLLRFLGYDGNDFQIRVPVTVQVGRKQTRGEADWVIWGATPESEHQAVIVIEAKEPGQQLDTTVQEQARSYAFGLNAPMYVLTNGRQLQVFRRGIQHDTCVVDCDVNSMLNSWTMIEQAIGADARPDCSPNV